MVESQNEAVRNVGNDDSEERTLTVLEAEHRSRKRKGIACFVTASLLYVLAAAALIVMYLVVLEIRELYHDFNRKPPRKLGNGVSFFAMPVISFCFAVGAKLWHTGRRMCVRDARLVLQKADPKFVLYLRSFSDDESQQSDFGIGFDSHARFRFTRVQTEQRLCRTLERCVGPVVAIGRPGEKLPELGAYRLYVDDSQWKSEVLALAERATLVVLRTGSSKGLHWELDQLLRGSLVKKVILYSDRGKFPVEFIERLRILGVSTVPRYSFLLIDQDSPSVFGSNRIDDVLEAKHLFVPRSMAVRVSSAAYEKSKRFVRIATIRLSSRRAVYVFVFLLTLLFALVTATALDAMLTPGKPSFLVWGLSFLLWTVFIVLAFRYLPVTESQSKTRNKPSPSKQARPSLSTVRGRGHAFVMYVATSWCLCYSVVFMLLAGWFLMDRKAVYDMIRSTLGGDHAVDSVLRMLALFVGVQLISMVLLWRINRRIEAAIPPEPTR